MFRLVEDRAVINRLGFNNEGIEPARRRLTAVQGRPGIRGINIGANKDSADRVADYVTGQGTRHARLVRHRQHLIAQHAGPARPAEQR